MRQAHVTTTQAARPVHQPEAKADTGSRFALNSKLVIFMFAVMPLTGVAVIAISQSLADVRIASFSPTAIIGAFAGLASWVLVTLYRGVPGRAGRVAAAFAVFGVVVLASALLGGVTRQGIQFVQVLASATGAMLLAAAVRESRGLGLDHLIAKCMRAISLVLILASVAGWAGAPVNVSSRPSAIVALIPLGWFLSEHRSGRPHSLEWAFALFAAIAISLSRSASFAAFLVVAATLIAGSQRHRLRNAALGAVLVIGGYWAASSWAPLHDRLFQGDVSLSVGGVGINAEGRTAVWRVLWEEVPRNLWLGHGPGAASARSLAIDPTFDQPHNDYLRLLFDFGVVGCAALGWVVIRVTRGLSSRRPLGSTSLPARASQLSGFAIMIVMVTDNPLDYPFVMIPLGALIGVGLGSARPQNPNMQAVRPASADQPA